MPVQTFKIPQEYKRALALVAADQGITPSDILRDCVETAVRDYKDGLFFDIAVRDDIQDGTDKRTEKS